MSPKDGWKRIFIDELSNHLQFCVEDSNSIIDYILEEKINGVFLKPNREEFQKISNPLGSFYNELTSDSGEKIFNSNNQPSPTPSIEKASEIHSSPITRISGIPLWFVFIFPDVYVWYVENQRNLGDKDIFQFSNSETNIFDGLNKLQLKYLKLLVNSYKSMTKKQLETADENIYLGVEELKARGTESVFTLIAENTMKYYAELLKNYSHKFDQQFSILALAGILDAQGYIAQSRISYQEIIEIAKSASKESNVPITIFIFELIVKLVTLDNPTFDRNFIRKAIYEDACDSINLAIDRVKKSYIGEAMFVVHVKCIMTEASFKDVRSMVGLI